MIGATYPGLFGLQQPSGMTGLPQVGSQYNLPPLGVTDPSSPAAPAQPAQSFIWGGSGDRLTDADIAQREQITRQELANGMSFAPVQSWTQGAARVAQALVGGFEQRSLDNASAANVAANKSAIGMLTDPRANEATIVSMIADPTLSDGLHDYATMKLAALNKAPPKPSEFDSNLIAAGIMPADPRWATMHLQKAQNDANPMTAVQVHDPVTGRDSLQFYPRGGPGIGAPAPSPVAPAIGTVEDGHRFKGGNPADPASWEVVGGAAPQAPVPFPIR